MNECVTDMHSNNNNYVTDTHSLAKINDIKQQATTKTHKAEIQT